MNDGPGSADSRRFFVCPVCRRWYEEGVQRCPDHDVELQLAKRPPGSLIGENLDGRYHIDGIIGEGGMGMVYTAVQQPIDRPIAVKVLKPELIRDKTVVSRFYKEAQAASALVNPNTITVHDFGQTSDGSLYIAMELLEGATLGEILENGAMPPEQVIAIAVQVSRALTEAHRKGIVHRDLKPENIMLLPADDGSILTKVLDFGIAKILKPIAPSPAGEPVTREGRIVGTPLYMAPEIAKGKPPTPASDLYSFGVILYEMIAGQPPFDDSKAIVLLGMHIKTPPPVLVSPYTTMPPQLPEIVTRLLEKAPEDRPQSVDEVHELLKLLHGETRIAATAVLGEASRGVPDAHRLPPSASFQEIAFADVAETDRLEPFDEQGSSSKTAGAEAAAARSTLTTTTTEEQASLSEPSNRAPQTVSFDAAKPNRRGGTTFTAVRRRWGPGLVMALGTLTFIFVMSVVGYRVLRPRSSSSASVEDTAPLGESQVSELIGAETLPEPERDEPDSGEAPIEISTQISSSPPGAIVTLGTEHLCQTPCRANLSANETIRLRFRMRGYRSESVLHTPREGQDVSVTLTPIDRSP